MNDKYMDVGDYIATFQQVGSAPDGTSVSARTIARSFGGNTTLSEIWDWYQRHRGGYAISGGLEIAKDGAP